MKKIAAVLATVMVAGTLMVACGNEEAVVEIEETTVVEETTGIYGIRKEALEKYQCRIGKKPYIHIVDKFEAVDINTEEDLKIAEYIGKVHFN